MDTAKGPVELIEVHGGPAMSEAEARKMDELRKLKEANKKKKK